MASRPTLASPKSSQSAGAPVAVGGSLRPPLAPWRWLVSPGVGSLSFIGFILPPPAPWAWRCRALVMAVVAGIAVGGAIFFVCQLIIRLPFPMVVQP